MSPCLQRRPEPRLRALPMAALARLAGAALALLAGEALAADARVFVANNGAQSVSAIDPAADVVVGTSTVGANPTGVAASADGRRVWVANAASDTVSALDAAAGTVVATIAVGDNPTALAVSPDGTRLYALGAAGVDVVDVASGAVVASVALPSGNGGGIAVSPDGSEVWVAAGPVTVIDAASNAVVASFLPEAAPVQDVSNNALGVAFSPDGTRAYVSRYTFHFGSSGFSAGGGVVFFEAATRSVVATVETGSLPGTQSIAVTPDGSRVYVGLVSTWVNVGTAQGFAPAKVVAAVSTATSSVVGWTVVANVPAGVAAARDGSEVHVAVRASNAVQAISTATNAIVATVPVGASPAGVAALELPEPEVALYCFGDGSGAACPCGNASAVGADEGCLHSLGLGGRLRTSGVARIGADTLVLEGSQMPDSTALYFQGTTQVAGGAGAPFGDGLRCAGGQVIRLGAETNAGGASQFPGPGDPSISVRGQVTQPGSERTYQVWYRNPVEYCTAETTNYTNAALVRWEL